MTKFTVSDSLGDQLDGISAPVELCDSKGRVLGDFIPALDISPEQLDADGCPYTIEQLREARRQTGGRPLAEIWRELGQS